MEATFDHYSLNIIYLDFFKIHFYFFFVFLSIKNQFGLKALDKNKQHLWCIIQNSVCERIIKDVPDFPLTAGYMLVAPLKPICCAFT